VDEQDLSRGLDSYSKGALALASSFKNGKSKILVSKLILNFLSKHLRE
jgi:hypothetical protein